MTSYTSCCSLDVDSVLPSSPSRRRASKREAEESKSGWLCTYQWIQYEYNVFHFVCCTFTYVEPVVTDLKFDLKQCMDKIRTLAMGKNKDISVSTCSCKLLMRRILIQVYVCSVC